MQRLAAACQSPPPTALPFGFQTSRPRIQSRSSEAACEIDSDSVSAIDADVAWNHSSNHMDQNTFSFTTGECRFKECHRPSSKCPSCSRVSKACAYTKAPISEPGQGKRSEQTLPTRMPWNRPALRSFRGLADEINVDKGDIIEYVMDSPRNENWIYVWMADRPFGQQFGRVPVDIVRQAGAPRHEVDKVSRNSDGTCRDTATPTSELNPCTNPSLQVLETHTSQKEALPAGSLKWEGWVDAQASFDPTGYGEGCHRLKPGDKLRRIPCAQESRGWVYARKLDGSSTIEGWVPASLPVSGFIAELGSIA